jgi:N-methylhydantoinase A/oxoprolinase/acetone carboxylase beta subunit
VRGGLEVDGRPIAELDEQEIRLFCDQVRQRQDIHAVVVVGVFSPIDTGDPDKPGGTQEQRAARVIREEIPGCPVVCSAEVANLGFVERENAAVLNASILAYARRAVRSFAKGVRQQGLDCPVFVAQNDGTVLTGDMAARLPIRTVSSGPTNSMRGAAFLVRGQLDEAVMVVDIGGTTTDVGLLLANGFPRQQAAYSELAGVRMNFSCPDIKSIGLGGGSIIRRGSTMIVGPDSVGYKLTELALIFGGDTLTATDCSVFANPSLDIGDRSLIGDRISEHDATVFQSIVKYRLEKLIDTMKTSPDDVPVILVGGGAIIAPNELVGASKVLKPRWSEVANAIGAATAGVSAVVDTVKSTESRTTQQLLEEISRDAIEKTIAAGASRDSVKIVEMETLPLQVRRTVLVSYHFTMLTMT